MSRHHLPSDFDLSALAAAMATDHDWVIGQTKSLTTTYLDTFDWRLWRAGLVLIEEHDRESRQLVLLERDRKPYVVAVGNTPQTMDNLPIGHLANRIAPLMGIRALIAIGAARVKRRDGRIENTEGEMLAPVRLEEVEPLDREGRVSAAGLSALQFRGGSVEQLTDLTAGLAVMSDHDLEMVAATRGRVPGDYSSKLRLALDPEQPADSTLRTILLELLTAVEANVEGTIDDIDIEFLHDLRVACRRTRSALTQLKGVLPADTIAPYGAEFKWLGGMTGPLRDLDVYLLEMPIYRAALPDHLSADLDPIEDLIVAARVRAHTSVVGALKSTRFKNLVANWRRTLEAVEPGSSERGTRPTSDLAARRISRATRRILKRGSGLDADPPAEALHRLRIDAKKLRYLLEFFSSLYPEREINARIKELKRLQDILGGFNDMEVQHDRLSVFARELHTDAGVETSCLLALGRLAGTLEERQEGFRLAFHDAFAEFSSARVRNAYGRLFGGKESK